jgi:hypothetical protein
MQKEYISIVIPFSFKFWQYYLLAAINIPYKVLFVYRHQIAALWVTVLLFQESI